MKRILIISNNSAGLYQFRREVIQAITKVARVYICVPKGRYYDYWESLGCKMICCDIERHGTNPIHEIKLLFNYLRIINTIKPHVVLTYTIKPNIYGGIACRLTHTPYLTNITGLGISLENQGLVNKITKHLYKIGIKKSCTVFFQNRSNFSYMKKNRLLSTRTKAVLLPGSGINLLDYCYQDYPSEKDKVILLVIGRIMKDKGINEVLKAAEIIKNKYNNIIIRLVGNYDDEYKDIINSAQNEKGTIEFLGFMEDTHSCYKDCHAVINASYHEGMSNVLLEAAATGRPVIATDVPGCKETYIPNLSGYACKPKNVDSLVEAIEKFIALPYEEKAKMGIEGRKHVEKIFDRNIVIQKYMKEIERVVN